MTPENDQIQWGEICSSLFLEHSPLCILVSSLGFEGLLLAVPALILQLLQLLQDSSWLVGGVDQHAQQLEAKAEFRLKIIKSWFNWKILRKNQSRAELHKHEGTKLTNRSHQSPVGAKPNTHTHMQKVQVHVNAQTQSLEKLRGCFAKQ